MVATKFDFRPAQKLCEVHTIIIHEQFRSNQASGIVYTVGSYDDAFSCHGHGVHFGLFIDTKTDTFLA